MLRFPCAALAAGDAPDRDIRRSAKSTPGIGPAVMLFSICGKPISCPMRPFSRQDFFPLPSSGLNLGQ
jgi:hypothetical protein